MMKKSVTIAVTDLLSTEKKSIQLDQEKLPQTVIQQLEAEEIFIAPGLTDLQVNGFKGIDLNAESLTVSEVRELVHALLKVGVTTFLPTLITNDPAHIERNIVIIKDAMQQYAEVAESIYGLHLEGPFISKSEGARGAHPAQWVREPDIDLFFKWQRLSGDRIKLITLSPEYASGIALIKACAENNINVAIGHTNASPEQINAAVESGASMSTHLGNGMYRVIDRHHNPLFSQLGRDELYASIIADGHHLSEDLVKIITRTKMGKTLLVSDATAFTGMKAGVYHAAIGGKVRLDGHKRLSMHENDNYLAGSASSLLDCINYLQCNRIFAPGRAWEMASILPLAYLQRNAKVHSEVIDKKVLLFFMKDNLYPFLTIQGQHYYYPDGT